MKKNYLGQHPVSKVSNGSIAGQRTQPLACLLHVFSLDPKPNTCVSQAHALSIELKEKKFVFFFNCSWMGCTELNRSPKEEVTMKRVSFTIKESQELIILNQ